MNKPFIETERLIGFIPQLACHDDYADMLSNKDFIACYGVSYNKEKVLVRLESDINHWNKQGFAPWMWYDKKTHQYVGRGGLKTFLLNQKNEVELTYQIKRDYWGQGLSVEMGLASIDYAFKKLHLDSLICFTAHNNHQSLRVMQKLGFIFTNDFVHADIIHKLHRIDRQTYLTKKATT